MAEALASASNDVEAALQVAAKAEDDVQASIREKERSAGILVCRVPNVLLTCTMSPVSLKRPRLQRQKR